MNINLRKANSLQLALKELIDSIQVKDSIELDEFSLVSLQIANAMTEANNNVIRKSNLINVLYYIRDKISDANYTSSITSKLTKCAAFDAKINLYAGIQKNPTNIDVEILQKKIDKISNGENKSFYGTREVSVCVVNGNDAVHFNNLLIVLKRDKQKLKDEILALNLTTEIALDTYIVEILQKEGLL